MSVLLTLEEVADRLRCGKRTVEREISVGNMKSVKVRGRRLVAEAELDRYVRLAERRGRMS